MARIKFKKGLQSKLLQDYFNVSGLAWFEIAEVFNISQRTLLDWRREKYTLSEDALDEIINSAGEFLKIPKHIIIPEYWNIRNAAKKGGKITAEKYGGPGTAEGRKKGGRNSQKKRKLFPELYQNCNLRKKITTPKKSSDLAEFFGIFLGDGGISNDFQITISFNRKNGYDHYKKSKRLIERIFKIKPAVYTLSSPVSKNVIRLVVSSVELVEFLGKNNIKKGSKVKNQVDVPGWIKRNKIYSKSCLRGLVDTDGGVYYHHHSNGKRKSLNMGLCFTNKSRPLLDFVERTLKKEGFHPKKSWSGDNVFLYRESEVLQYKERVGFSNLHQNRRVDEYLKIKKRKGA